MEITADPTFELPPTEVPEEVPVEPAAEPVVDIVATPVFELPAPAEEPAPEVVVCRRSGGSACGSRRGVGG